MLNLIIKGGTKKERELCYSLSCFLCNRILTKREIHNISIEINLLKKIDDENTQGYIDFEEPPPNRLIRKFTVYVLSSIPTKQMLVALAHEFVHLKQLHRKEFRAMYSADGEIKSLKWKNRRKEYLRTEYDLLPWEIEAKQLEEKLVKEYLWETL